MWHFTARQNTTFSVSALFDRLHPTLVCAPAIECPFDTGNEFHALLVEQVIPDTRENYDLLVASVSGFSSESMLALQNLIDHPEAVTVQAIESLNTLVSETTDATTEQLSDLKARSAEIIEL